jgi:hypothetical protein
MPITNQTNAWLRAQMPLPVTLKHMLRRASLTLSLPKSQFMRLLGSAPKSHLCDQKRRSNVTGLSDLMTLFVDLGCLYCKQTQRAFNVFKNTLNWLKIDSVDKTFYWLECGNFSQDAGTPGTERVIAFSQLAVKRLKPSIKVTFSATVASFYLQFLRTKTFHFLKRWKCFVVLL